jgi:hypothetical protein
MYDAYFMNYGAPGHELLAIFHELWCSSSCYICSTEMVLQFLHLLQTPATINGRRHRAASNSGDHKWAAPPATTCSRQQFNSCTEQFKDRQIQLSQE